MHLGIGPLLSHYGYVGVFLILLSENIGIPFPAETTLTLSGIEWTQGVFQLVPVLVAASVGNMVGSTIAYVIGRYFGRPVILKYGRYIGITESRLDKANATFEKYEATVVLFAKFIAGIRVLVPYLAGINKMSFLLFSLYNAASAIVWAATFIILGKYIDLEWRAYHAVLIHYLGITIVVVVVLIVAYVWWKIREHRRNKQVD